MPKFMSRPAPALLGLSGKTGAGLDMYFGMSSCPMHNVAACKGLQHASSYVKHGKQLQPGNSRSPAAAWRAKLEQGQLAWLPARVSNTQAATSSTADSSSQGASEALLLHGAPKESKDRC